MAAALRSALERDGYVVDHVSGIALAEEAVRSGACDLILLDRTLADGDGLSIVQVFREHIPGIPIIVITALGDVADRVEGLDRGADDYLAKPFAMDEMLARIRAVRRRPLSLPLQQIKLGTLTYDLENDEASVKGVRLEMPRRELLVLGALMRRRGRTVVRRSLEEAVYGFDDEIQSNTLDSHVSRLRRRLASVSADVEIHAIRGVGYLLRQVP